jgi:tRNA isopentenyl-2-thiomethyl-A-37 hydroxylase MiaE
MTARVRVEFIKSYVMNGVKWVVGMKAQMRKEKAEELIDKRIVRAYHGPWPPDSTQKTKFNLKDLK